MKVVIAIVAWVAACCGFARPSTPEPVAYGEEASLPPGLLEEMREIGHTMHHSADHE